MSFGVIPKVKEFKLIARYLYISDICEQALQYSCQRFCNNSTPAFTDEEIMAIYLYSMQVEQRSKVIQIYEFASD